MPVLADLDPDTITAGQLPVLVKGASAGGGGRGMRVIDDLGALPEAVRAARREAASAFGDGAVFCERYLPRGHHIEVQIMADAHGTVWAVGERGARFSSRIEGHRGGTLPSGGRIPGMRDRFTAARQAAWRSATPAPGRSSSSPTMTREFFFLEMNTRLQVEHPVTELTTGTDLVECATGGRRRCGARRRPTGRRGPFHRGPTVRGGPVPGLAASGPAPCTTSEVPGVATQFGLLRGSGLRLDSGIVDGSVVSVHYDPMLAEVICMPDPAARRRPAGRRAGRTRLHGLRTNRDLLVNVLRHPAFLAGHTDTAFFDSHGLDALAALAGPRAVRLSAIAAALATAAQHRAGARVLRPACPAVGAICRRATRTRLSRMPTAPSTGWPTGSPEANCCCPTIPV